MTSEEIKEWFETRRRINKPTTMKKFTESAWRFVFYLTIWIYGFQVLSKVILLFSIQYDTFEK
jgi:ceramide synthetase